VTRLAARGRIGAPRTSRARFGLLLALPATLLVLVLVGGPALQTIVLSFQEVRFVGESTFVGLENYMRLVASAEFWHSFRSTFLYTGLFLAISTILGLAFAILLHQPFRFRGLARTLLIVPWAVPWLLVGIIWKWFIDADVGALNGALYQFGVIDNYVPFLADPGRALLFTVLAASWRQAALSGLLFLAALQTIPHDLPEAAKVDGANAMQRFRYVTLPWIRPVTLVVLVTNTIFGFLQFDVIYAMTQGGPGNATNLLSVLLFKQNFQFNNIGVGSAVAVVLGLVAFGVGLLFVRFTYRPDVEHEYRGL
jgi:ABC-type sugar transport system permease subunit